MSRAEAMKKIKEILKSEFAMPNIPEIQKWDYMKYSNKT